MALDELVARAGLRDAYVWWTVTRGIPPMGRNEMVKASMSTVSLPMALGLAGDRSMKEKIAQEIQALKGM